MNRNAFLGHLAAFVTIVIWGTTFISTKVLLDVFHPIEILVIRFLLGYIALWIIAPRRLMVNDRKQEWVFALAGLCGICLYYLLENVALAYTSASNVGVIISIAPFFTALLTQYLMKQTTLHIPFYIGFVISMIGICLISFQGSQLELHPFGDVLACLAALLWACYAILSKKISEYGLALIPATRRMFAYGLLCMIPLLVCFDFNVDGSRFYHPMVLGNLLFLGLGASALCFVTWNYAVKTLGAVKTSVYIYMVPVITVMTSMLVLHEALNVQSGIGIALTLFGLCSSQISWKKKVRNLV